MRVKLELDLRLTAKTVWTVTCLTILQFGLGSLLLLNPQPYEAFPAYPLLSIMLLLSFPTSLAAVLAAGSYLTPVTHFEEFLVMWLCMFCAGYLQWFVFLPKFRKPKLITLGLTETSPSRATIRRRRKRRRKAAQISQHSAIDQLTPLERVIRTR